MTMTGNCGFTDDSKSTTGGQDTDSGGGCANREFNGNSQYFPLNFAVDLRNKINFNRRRKI